MNMEEFNSAPAPVQEAVRTLHERQPDGTPDFEDFVKRVHPPAGIIKDHHSINWCGMYVAIMEDGSTHT